MEPTELIDRVLRPHRPSLMAITPWGQSMEVTVAVPDLRSSPRTVGGDWGPSYRVSVPPDRPLAVWTRRSGTERIERRVLDLGLLEVESPVSAAVRRVTPLFMELPIVELRMRLRIFYDTRGHATRGEMVPLNEGGVARQPLAIELACTAS